MFFNLFWTAVIIFHKLFGNHQGMAKNVCDFLPEHYYHVFNRTNNKERLFVKRQNYQYFLRKYHEHLGSVLTTYAYCLLGNHFHLLVKVCSEERLSQLESTTDVEVDCNRIVREQFRIFVISYSKAFNRQEERYGSLLQRPFKRVEISSEVKYANMFYYIHANPELHKIVKDFRSYEWSSYQTLIGSKPTKMPREEILEWFGGVEKFINFHEEKQKET